MSNSSNGFVLWWRPGLSGPESTGGCAPALMTHGAKSYLEYMKYSLCPSPDMNGESDQPPAALIGVWAEDEDEPGAPPLQLPRNRGNARETRQIPNARSLEWGPSASNDMTFLPETYRTQATSSASPERKVDPAPFGSRPVRHEGPRATMTRVLALAREAYNTPLKGGDHEKNTRGIAVFLVRARMGPDRRRAAQRREEHRKPHHLRHGLRPEDVQPAQGNQQVQRQAPGSDLELQPVKRHGRALAADDLQRRHVRGQRQLDLCHRRRWQRSS